MRSIVVFAALGLGLFGTRVEGQEASAPRLETGSFFFARYGSVGASSLYAGHGFGPAGVMVALVQNPRTGYQELIGGLMTRAAWGGHTLAVAVAGADASDGTYLQTYLVPSLALGRLAVSGTVEWYEPLDGGVRQLDVNPLTAVVALHRNLAVGGVWTMGFADGSDWQARAGPAVHLTIPGATLGVEGLWTVRRRAGEIRAWIQAPL